MTKPDPNLGQDRIGRLQTFVRIVETGSLSAAAKQMRSTQPTVSRRLKALEKELGLQLLQRSTHAMRLTADGERCYERAKDLLASWEAFDVELRGSGASLEGVLRVVVPHAFGQDLFVRAMAPFLIRHPRLTVEWLLHDDQKLVDYIAAGVDCAIQVGEPTALDVVAVKLSEVPRIAVAAPGLLEGATVPEHPNQLTDLPWLALHTYYRNEVDLTEISTGETARIALRPRFATDSLYALRSAAVNGMGVCVGSAWVLADDLANGRLVHVVPKWQARPLPVYLVYPYAHFYAARLRQFIEVMKTAIPAVLADVTSPAAESPKG